MARRSRNRSVTAALLVLLAGSTLAFSACGKHHKAGEPVREGLGTPLDGVRYTVFITRQLNIRGEEDKGYYSGKEAPPGSALYGVFLEACNDSKRDATAASRFEIHDTQGNVFQPKAVPGENTFAYKGGTLAPGSCIPTRGSLAELGPTSGSMLLFQLPLSATENRPLELVIEGSFDAAAGKPSEARVTLDI
jgi:hypothetical protein